MVEENIKSQIESAVRIVRMHFDRINQAISPHNVNPRYREAQSELYYLENALNELESLLNNL